VLIGTIINKVDEIKKRRSRTNQYSVASKNPIWHQKQQPQPGRQNSELQFNFMRTNTHREEPASPDELMVIRNGNQQNGLGMITQPQVTNTEALRQQALRYNSRQNENNRATQDDALAQIRGGRTKNNN